MKDYANRNIQFEQGSQRDVLVPWRYVAIALLAMFILLSIKHHQVKNAVVKPKVVAQQVAKKPAVKFDFYQMLTKDKNAGQVAAAADNGKAQTSTTMAQAPAKPIAVKSKPAPTASKPQPYYLQVGGYEQRNLALQQKANLILAGVHASRIHLVRGQHGHYRVALGPFHNLNLAQREQQLLKQRQINGLMVKHEDLKA